MRLLFLIALALLLLAPAAWAQGTLRDDFEGPDVTLRDAGGDASYRIEQHQRVQQGAHSGRWCERLTVAGNNGTYVYVSHAVGPARIIGELAPSIWLKSDRGGLRMAVRAVLPRSTDPRTGQPLTTLIRGLGSAEYKQVGVWQQLRIDGLPQLLERQVRVLRTQFGAQVDAREAYVDLVLLNVYGGPGTTNVSVDDLEVAGVVTSSQVAESPVMQASANGPLLPLPGNRSTHAAGGSQPSVKLKGPLLLVGEKPYFVRSIEYRGEPLSRLKQLGFNTVRLSQTPTPQLLSEAASVGLWVIAPPPPARELQGRTGGEAKLGKAYDPVLTWDLGSGLSTRELEATRAWAKLVQAADPRERILMCDADSDLRGYTRPPIRLLLARREPIGTTLSLPLFGPWLQERNQLALGGTPLWATIQTDYSPRLLEQIQLLWGVPTARLGLQEAQIRTLIHIALASRARGLCFASSSRLDTGDEPTQRRAAILELMNLELDLIERWPAAGNFAPQAKSNEANFTGAVIETDRSRLLLPIYNPPQSQCVMGSTELKQLSFTVSGVPEGDNAYELTPASFRPLTSARKAGGTMVILGEAERDSLVVFTRDELVIRGIKTRLDKIRARAAELTYQIAAAESALVEATEARLTQVGHIIPATAKLRGEIQTQLTQSETALKTDPQVAYYQARRAQQSLRLIQRAHWDKAVTPTDWPLADPLTASFATLPEHYRLAQELSTLQRSGNRLNEGGFENLNAMLSAGWKHFEHRQANVTTSVDLLPQAAHSGQTGLRLRAAPEDPKNPPSVIETPPLWINSAPISVQPGDLVEIQGWLRLPGPIVGNVDGLLVIDTLAGESLALRATGPSDWRQFTMYRVATRTGPMSITFALAGMGEAWIDDVTIQILRRRTGVAATPAPPPGIPSRQ